MTTNFVYFSSGSLVLHNRTVLSALSLVENYALQAEEKIIIYTDDLAYYKRFLEGLPIEYKLLTKHHLKEMMGNDDLIHRVKIGIIEQTAKEYPNQKLFYVDSDTFFIKPFGDILNEISIEKAIMHKLEYPMDFLATYPREDKDGFGKMYELLLNHTFNVNNQKIKIDIDTFSSWNAGIIGLHPAYFDCFSQVYELTDQFYTTTHNHACEQYAFSYRSEERRVGKECSS